MIIYDGNWYTIRKKHKYYEEILIMYHLWLRLHKYLPVCKNIKDHVSWKLYELKKLQDISTKI